VTLGSLFDGIGGWLLAARHAGVTPVWASEIELFPCSVTARHFPDVKQLGDITQIDSDTLTPVDIICAGSPCQDLSIAGKRKGLNGERSGLFRTAVDLVRRMRERTAGKYPRFFVWENVPGAFSSSRGMDFQAVLEEIGESEIPMPQGNRWAPAGLVQCPRAEIAWRVLDAQYWGVPQRRKRIFLVADFAAHDRRAGEILFECEGVSGNPAESKGTRKGAARGTADCTRIAVYDMTHADEVMRPVKDGIVPTLNARMGTGGNQVPVVLTEGKVRRLALTECERLQGLEDGYTEGGSDTARYKALGNGMAQPCATYIIKRIAEAVSNGRMETCSC
jgi:DNA (cytosine-5)-methyltransferase 1